jgi:D-glycero-alpha-D-manno-heptose 1-phosphate guanylyltransferase
MKMLVLSGGFGTRLKPAIGDVPKPLAPISGRPFLDYQIDVWIRNGITSFLFLLHHKSEMLIDYLNDQIISRGGFDIAWNVEDRPLDTGGAVALAVRELKIKGQFLVANADSVVSGGFREMMDSEAPSVALIHQNDVERFGQVSIDEKQKIISFQEKGLSKNAGLINAGLYKLNHELFEEWQGKPVSLERGYFPELVTKNELTGVVLPESVDFIDIGIPEDYYRFLKNVNSGEKR